MRCIEVAFESEEEYERATLALREVAEAHPLPPRKPSPLVIMAIAEQADGFERALAEKSIPHTVVRDQQYAPEVFGFEPQ